MITVGRVTEDVVARRIALLFLALASPLLLVLFLIPGPFAETVFAALVMAYPVALIALAVARQGRLGPLGLPLVGLLILLEGCAVGMLLLRGRVLDGPWLGGLPLAAAIQLYGLFLAPLLLVALAYALTFDRFELRQQDLERLRKHISNRAGGEQ
jgi:hypothetical protein